MERAGGAVAAAAVSVGGGRGGEGPVWVGGEDAHDEMRWARGSGLARFILLHMSPHRLAARGWRSVGCTGDGVAPSGLTGVGLWCVSRTIGYRLCVFGFADPPPTRVLSTRFPDLAGLAWQVVAPFAAACRHFGWELVSWSLVSVYAHPSLAFVVPANVGFVVLSLGGGVGVLMMICWGSTPFAFSDVASPPLPSRR
ncbi:hypothetical protein I4F81_011447 [Pyropia yezoensis]|uniref:Uncharacterized protein n=1 Tax=Pyropia yezoensis TaxID=2788 RepID=A0ACC3CFH7_PYRYE|nr:hypothetical protein I4F81_011447 [Neopyropia yezoensis]